MRARSVTYLFLALMSLAGLATSIAIAAPTPASTLDTHGMGAAAFPCEQQQDQPIAILGRLVPGHTVTEVAASASAVAPEFSGPAASSSDEVVIFPKGGFTDSAVGTLRNDAAFAQVAVLQAHTADASLRSCEYRLRDNPRAASIADRGTTAMLAGDLLTSNEIEAPSTTFLLTDDPFDSSKLYFAVILQRPTGSPVTESRTPIVAVIDRGTLAVTSVEVANWYVGQ